MVHLHQRLPHRLARSPRHSTACSTSRAIRRPAKTAVPAGHGRPRAADLPDGDGSARRDPAHDPIQDHPHLPGSAERLPGNTVHPSPLRQRRGRLSRRRRTPASSADSTASRYRRPGPALGTSAANGSLMGKPPKKGRKGGGQGFTWNKGARPATDFAGTDTGSGDLWTAHPNFDWRQPPAGTAASFVTPPLAPTPASSARARSMPGSGPRSPMSTSRSRSPRCARTARRPTSRAAT